MKIVKIIPVILAMLISACLVTVSTSNTFSAGTYADKPFVHSLFADHMILQRDVENPVWGWTNPGEKVTVEIGGQTSTGVADQSGKWSVKIGPFPKGGPYQMTVTGSQTKTISDILFGEVWLCSGQSNMVMQLREAANGTTEVQNANYPNIRYFNVPHGYNSVPQDKFSYPDQCKWQVLSPQTAPYVSAVGYFFARKLHNELDVPVGIIVSAVGGTKIECWTSMEMLKTYEDYQSELNYLGNANSVTGLYNGMIAPVVPYRIKGTLWYQGEANTEKDYRYGKLLSSLIIDWRSKFGIGDFPFIIIQLPNIAGLQNAPVQNGSWTLLREAQLVTSQRDANSGLIVTIDVGDSGNVHPTNKQDVGIRSAQCALGKYYDKILVPEGPLYKSMSREGNKIRITFDNAGSGLMVGKKTGLEPVQEITGGTLKGFAIAGPDKNFVWADAMIENNTVVLSAATVTEPVAVRYSWSDNPIGNLYNKEGIPASPFRTDRDYRLEVLEGTASGIYKEGEVVSITANPAPAGKKFEKWVGDTGSIENVMSSSTKLIMRPMYTCIRANYVDINATIAPLPTPTPTPLIMKGDASVDGIVNSNDYTLLKRYLLKIIDKFPNPGGSKAADVNSDGLINSTDLTLLKRYILGIISSF
ncbi:MAG: sialate O-acetylesterase [Bacillota bacterium]